MQPLSRRPWIMSFALSKRAGDVGMPLQFCGVAPVTTLKWMISLSLVHPMSYLLVEKTLGIVLK